MAACDLILEYTLSAAAVAKGFTAYLASLLHVDLHHMRLQYGILTLGQWGVKRWGAEHLTLCDRESATFL